MRYFLNRLGAFFCFALLAISIQAQSPEDNKPYQIKRTGKQITIKSNKGIKQVMVWTSNGNRVSEHREINNNNWVMDLPVNQKAFFLMIGLNNGKIYTEKIGTTAP